MSVLLRRISFLEQANMVTQGKMATQRQEGLQDVSDDV